MPTLLFAAVALGAVDKWVAEQGVTHYSQTPPAEGAKEVDIPSGPRREEVHDAQRRLEVLLHEQKRRDEARDAEQVIRRQQKSLERRQAMKLASDCLSAQSWRSLFKALARFSQQDGRAALPDPEK